MCVPVPGLNESSIASERVTIELLKAVIDCCFSDVFYLPVCTGCNKGPK